MRQKYIHTAESDDIIRALYQNGETYGVKAIGVAAKRLGWPRFAIKARASQLGIARTREQPWSTEELLILDRWAHQHPSRIRMKLKASGFHRSATAIVLKRKRLNLLSTLDGYSGCQLGELFGIDPHKITRWIEQGYLRAERRGTERSEAQGGDIFFITHGSVFQFALKHPNEYDLAKVDKIWFLDMITQSKAVWTGEYRPSAESRPEPKCLQCGSALTRGRVKFCELRCCEQYRLQHKPQIRKKRLVVQSAINPQPATMQAGRSPQTETNSVMAKNLSPQQRQVLELLLKGLRPKDVAVYMNISAKTVDCHKRLMMQKLGVTSQVELVKLAIQHGLTSLQVA